MTHTALQQLLQQGTLWRGKQSDSEQARIEPSGWPLLDHLIGGGWPHGALSELLSDRHIGLKLLIPTLARLSRGERWLAWVGSPYTPYVPALAAHEVETKQLLLIREHNPDKSLWAAEQAMQSGACSMVLLWPKQLQTAQLRRLQLAAETGNCLGILFRPLGATQQNSPAALRLRVEPTPIGLDIHILKRRGGWGGKHCAIKIDR